MKAIKITLLLAIPFFIFSSFKMSDDHCLEIKGTVLDAKDKKLDKVKVILMENGKELSSMETKCPFKMEFPRNHYYSMIISKEGYLPAVIIIDTNVPVNHKECGFHFEFHYNMIAENNDYNKDYVDFPAAVVKYMKSTDEFLISDKYNKHIKKLIGADL